MLGCVRSIAVLGSRINEPLQFFVREAIMLMRVLWLEISYNKSLSKGTTIVDGPGIVEPD